MAKKKEKTEKDIKKDEVNGGVDEETRETLKTALVLSEIMRVERQNPAKELLAIAQLKEMMDGNVDTKSYFMAKITKDGRITIPSEFREIQGLGEGYIVQLMLVEAFSGK